MKNNSPLISSLSRKIKKLSNEEMESVSGGAKSKPGYSVKPTYKYKNGKHYFGVDIRG